MLPLLETVSNQEMQIQNAFLTVLCLPKNNLQQVTHTHPPFLRTGTNHTQKNIASLLVTQISDCTAGGSDFSYEGFDAAGPRLLAALGSSARAERIQRERGEERAEQRETRARRLAAALVVPGSGDC